MSLKIYKKKLDYSYSFGVYPTLELINRYSSQIRSILINSAYSNDPKVAEIINLAGTKDIPIDTADKAISKIAPKGNTKVVGVFDKYDSKLNPQENHIILVNPSSPSNLGTMIRSMIGFNANNLAIVGEGLDIFDPQVISTSVGAFFYLNFEYYTDFEQYKLKFANHTYYPFLLDGNSSLHETSFNHPSALIFGNEGEGLDESYRSLNNTIKINHSKNIESLNLATSISIALYELSKNTIHLH